MQTNRESTKFAKVPFPHSETSKAGVFNQWVAEGRLDVEPDLRCCLAVTQPRIQKLVDDNNIKNRIK